MKNRTNIFDFSPNRINIEFPMNKDKSKLNLKKIEEEIDKLKLPEKGEIYLNTINEFGKKYLHNGTIKKDFTLEEYNSLLSELEHMKEVLSTIPFVLLDMYDDNISFFNLSHGERSILLLNTLLYESVTVLQEQDLLICLDEPDLSLHPQWQKKYINELVKMFSKSTKNLHFLITSHSPFILSDLPKENVIFLEKGKQVDVDINPFGANIHTLLSHGFFMKDGLMGEFAKEKINDAIKYLNQKSLSKGEIDYCENIISIIGEPILKRQLQKMLDSKRLSKIDKIDKLEEELELIKHRIEMIRKNQ